MTALNASSEEANDALHVVHVGEPHRVSPFLTVPPRCFNDPHRRAPEVSKQEEKVYVHPGLAPIHPPDATCSWCGKGLVPTRSLSGPRWCVWCFLAEIRLERRIRLAYPRP